MSTTAKDRGLATTLIESWIADTRPPDGRVIDEHEARLAEAIAAVRKEERERAAVNAMIALGRTRKFAERRVRELAGGAAAFTYADRVINCILRGDK